MKTCPFLCSWLHQMSADANPPPHSAVCPQNAGLHVLLAGTILMPRTEHWCRPEAHAGTPTNSGAVGSSSCAFDELLYCILGFLVCSPLLPCPQCYECQDL